jgi:hypothetical protein
MFPESESMEPPTIEINETDIRVRSNFSAVMRGVLAANDHMAGDVIARDSDGEELQHVEMSVSYALGGRWWAGRCQDGMA